jgi:hypothetical protein
MLALFNMLGPQMLPHFDLSRLSFAEKPLAVRAAENTSFSSAIRG